MSDNKPKGATDSSAFDEAEESAGTGNKPYVDIEDVPEKARIEFSKKFRNANLADDGFFALLMQQKDFCVQTLSIILEKDIVDIEYNTIQQTIKNMPGYKSIRLDVFAVERNGTVYNVEMQIKMGDSLPRRSRYYQGLIDASILFQGKKVKYASLADTYVIFISEFDLFDKDFYRYTFRNRCDEDSSLCLNDGAVKMFLNTEGHVRNSESDLLIQFLKFVKNTTKENTGGFSCLEEMFQLLQAYKGDGSMEMKYIEQNWAREEGREEGWEKGREEGWEEGRLKTAYEIYLRLTSEGFDKVKALNIAGLSLSDLQRINQELSLSGS